MLDSLSNDVVNVEEKLLNANVNTTTGISTFNKVSIGSSLYTDHILVGTGTDVRVSRICYYCKCENSTFFVDSSGTIGIGTKFGNEDNPDIGIFVPDRQAMIGGIGIGTTTSLRCAVDFADAGTVGLTTTHRYFLPPKIGTTDRNGIGITETGATIYNVGLK